VAERSDYVEVHERIQQFHEKYPSGSLQTEYTWDERDGERWLVVKAYAYRDPEDTRPGIGHAWEPVPGRTPYTRGSELMVGETSAWGRALAALGIAVHKGVATGGEIRAAEGRKIERTKPTAEDEDAWQTRPSSLPARKASGKQLQYIANLCRKMNTTDPADILALVNAALVMSELPVVAQSAELSDAQARAVIDTFKTAQDSPTIARQLAGLLPIEMESPQPAEL
jgi:hypothetical protein